MRVVLDTSVLISALRSPAGASAEILRRVFLGEIALLMDYKLSCEYEAVALRPEQLHATGRSRAEVLEFLGVLCDVAEPVTIGYFYRPLSQDANDDMILELAINGNAQAILSYNIRHFKHPLRGFGIEVFVPSEFLGLLSRRS